MARTTGQTTQSFERDGPMTTPEPPDEMAPSPREDIADQGRRPRTPTSPSADADPPVSELHGGHPLWNDYRGPDGQPLAGARWTMERLMTAVRAKGTPPQ